MLSPVLFSLFINELADVMMCKSSRGIQLIPDIIELFLLLFADDVTLFADTVRGLQSQLNILSDYYTQWDLTVNLEKTNIVVFRKGGQLSRKEKLTYKGNTVKCVSGYTYLDLLLSAHMSYYLMSEQLAVKSKKALLSVLSSITHMINLPSDVYFKIFDA